MLENLKKMPRDCASFCQPRVLHKILISGPSTLICCVVATVSVLLREACAFQSRQGFPLTTG